MAKIGDVFKTNNFGEVEVIEVFKKDKVRIRFKNTGFEREAFVSNLHKGVCRDLSVTLRKLRGKLPENRFCVYLHKDSTGKVRYVGEGTLDRAYTKSRWDQPTWMEVFSDTPPIVEIVAKDLLKKDAEDLELKIRDLYEDLINNPHATKKAKEILFDHISKYVYYDDTSPTCIRWISDMKNKAKAGSPAGHIPKSSNKHKYCYVEIGGEAYAVHRVVWVLHNKTLSTTDMIDHVDGNKLNNCIENLRITDAKKNSHNRLGKIPNSGFRNIGAHRRNGEIYCYIVSWSEFEHSDRQWKLFSLSEYGSLTQALNAAYHFRDTLIDRGVLPKRIKEGEEPR